MTTRRSFVFALAGGMLASCGAPQAPVDAPSPTPSAASTPEPRAEPVAVEPSMPSPTFEQDVAYLRQHGDVQLLTSPQGARLAVSAKYQGRVMTSAVAPDGASFGFIDRRFIDAGKTGTQFDNYGGEDRFWLGPEGGQFGLYFPPGKPFEFQHWQTPSAFQQGAWDIVEQSEGSIRFRRAMEVTNYSGTRFKLDVERTVSFVDSAQAADLLGAPIPDGVRLVAYQTGNEVTNTGTRAWTKQGGLISIWILAMYTPSPDLVVIAPFEKSGSGRVINDEYFGKVPADRLIVDEQKGVALFRCDGHHRSKIGLPLGRTKSVLGSYSASARMLTIVQFNGPVEDAPYVNSMWEQQKEPYGGDVVNSYNDGPTEPGKPALGGFYEIETSSPGLQLAPGADFQHVHRTFHLVGDQQQLEPFARAQLGVSLAYVQERMGGRPTGQTTETNGMAATRRVQVR